MDDVIRRLLAVVLLAVALPVGLAAPSSAACAKPVSFGQRATQADDVFTASVTSRSRSGDLVAYKVTVATVYQGTVSTEQVTVTTGARRADCGQAQLEKGRRYLFFARERSGRLTIGSAAPSVPASAANVARIEKLLGQGHPAVAPEPAPQHATFTTVASRPMELRRVAAPGGALVIIGLLGLLVASWRGRRRA